MHQDQVTMKNESCVSLLTIYIHEELKNSDGMTDLIFEFEIRFHHMQPATNTPPQHARFVFGFPNHNDTPFSYTDLLNTSDLPHCSTS